MLLGSSASYEGVEATGGTETTYADGGITYKVHTFSSTGTGSFVVGNGGSVSYLIVAGGGSGGAGRTNPFTEWPGGGGGGGLLESTTTVSTGTTYTITVGDGGAARTSAPQKGANGDNSSAFSIQPLVTMQKGPKREFR